MASPEGELLLMEGGCTSGIELSLPGQHWLLTCAKEMTKLGQGAAFCSTVDMTELTLFDMYTAVSRVHITELEEPGTQPLYLSQ